MLNAVDLHDGDIVLTVLNELHRSDLRAAAEADATIWSSLYPYSMIGDAFDVFWDRIMLEQRHGRSIPFAFVRAGRCVGITCFLEIDSENYSVNIGGTYYRPEHRGGITNVTAKFLLLDHAFKSGVRRVQFRVDELNQRSRAAMAKLGAHQDGVLRKDKVTWTGRVRSTVIYSILKEEWDELRQTLKQRMRGSEV